VAESDNSPAAGNGLLDRRFFLKASVAGGATLMSAQACSSDRPDWMRGPGAPMSEIGAPSEHEAHVRRNSVWSKPGTTGVGISLTPLELLDGIITPSRLHFERHHSGIPAIDPDEHRLFIHGLVERPLSFSVDALSRYQTISRIQFLECSGNSGASLAPDPVRKSCSQIHGLVSASEWGGVPLSILLQETGIKPQGKWIVAAGADAAMMSRSVPLDKVMDDAIVALYQNGERLRPSNGYPMRLFLPGWEGNMSIKWLRTIKIVDKPAMTRDETSKYSDLQSDGIARLFTFPMGVKSIITSPSHGLRMGAPGVYQISGIAWTGAGKIKRVEVSADGGKSWADAAFDEHVMSKCLTRFRSAWRWDGSSSVILSRATDEAGNVQPTRDAVLEGRAKGNFYHCNGIQAWHVGTNRVVSNVYA
jgi:sulfane dehydrogenase subunit SoxC